MATADKLKLSTRLADYAFWCFVLGVVLLPVGLGGNRTLPFGLAQGASALACFGYVFAAGKRGMEPCLFMRLRVALGLFVVVALWAWLQTKSFVPSAWLHPLWKEASDVLSQPLHGAIALSPEDALVGLNRLITYIAVGLLAYVLGQDPKRARQMAAALWVSGIVVCIYGLINYILGINKILWLDKWAYQGDLTATFVNRNDFAIYAGMVLVSGAALLAQNWKEQVQAIKPSARMAAWRDWLSREGGLRLLSLLLVFLCIVLSHSRAGLTLSVLGLGCYFFFYQLYRQNWRRAIFTGVIAAAALFLVFLVALEYSERFANLFMDYSSKDRLKVYQLMVSAIGDNPWLGYGLNGFQPVFRLYERGMIMEFQRAHSDVLESLLDLGIPVGLMLWSALVLLISGLVRGIFHRRRHGMFPCLGLAACVMVVGHATVDFSMQIPGVVVPWAMLLGAGLAQSWRHSDKAPAHEWEE